MAGPRRRSLTQRGMVFCSGGVTLTIGGLALGYVDIARVGVLLAVLPLLTLLLRRRTPPELAVTRRVEPGILQPDERAEVTVTFRNSGRRGSRLYLAEEQVDYVLGDRPRFLLPGLPPGAARQLSYTVRCSVRGLHRVGPVQLREVDPFGLTVAHRSIRSTDELLVLPRIVPLTSSRPPGAGMGSEGEVPQMVALHGAEDVSIRTYHDGDDLRKVHWPATAHRGELMVRQEEQPTRRSAVILLDSRASAHVGTGLQSSFEWAVSAAASIAVRLGEIAYSIHLASPATAAAQQVERPVPAAQVVRWLAVADTDTDDAHRVSVALAHDVVRTGAIIVAIVTDLEGDAATIARMRQSGASGIAMVLDTASFEDRQAAPSRTAESIREELAAAGWRALIVRSDTDIRQAWQTVAARNLTGAGAS